MNNEADMIEGFSSMPHNEESCQALAIHVTEFWDTSTLAEFAVQVLTERYLADKELFLTDARQEDELSGALDNLLNDPLDED